MKIRAVHFNEVEESRVEMEGAKDVFIRWLVSKDDEAPNFYMRLFIIKPDGHTPLINIIMNMRYLSLMGRR
ncbi:MAG: hypothetical protein ACP5QK_00920 [Myxococcota bacterium]